MKNRFNSITDILSGGLLDRIINPDFRKTNRIFKYTRLENEIFRDLLSGSHGLQEIRKNGDNQLPTFSDLTRDVFTAFYTLALRPQDENDVSGQAKRFNKPILEDLLADAEFGAIKSVCEGRELPAFDACEEFSARILEKLPELMKKLGGGNPELPKVIDGLTEQAEELKNELSGHMEQAKTSPEFEKKAVKTANQLDAKLRQIEDLENAAHENAMLAGPAFKAAVSEAAQSAKDKAEETANAISAWGDSAGDMGNTPVNRELLQKVRANEKLQQIARMLGRYREMIADKRKNGFTYGLGEKYDITAGNDINLCLASELALLATPETQALFLQKYRKKSLKQYRKREAVTKGAGDMIVCCDESGSMSGVLDWAKAFALALLDIAARDRRRFALIHFASASELKIDVFLPGEYTAEKIFEAAEHNFNGSGTDFEAPLAAAMKLSESGFEQADIVFITDGECAISQKFAESFSQQKQKLGCTVTGILMDKDQPDAGMSLVTFCNSMFRSSVLTEDALARVVISQKA